MAQRSRRDPLANLRSFFQDPEHLIYKSGRTPSQVSPTSIFHVGQVEVLLEDQQFHWLTNDALQTLRSEGTLRERVVKLNGSQLTLVWARSLRYPERAIGRHLATVSTYSASTVTKASGDYAEVLVQAGLGSLGLRTAARESRTYGDRTWVSTGHDLDFIMEGSGAAFGVEVKNTFSYLPDDELAIKLDMCDFLGLRPLFIVRVRHAKQWELVRARGGMIYQFKTKVFPPGQEAMAESIWNELKLPVAVWKDWPPAFGNVLGPFVSSLTLS